MTMATPTASLAADNSRQPPPSRRSMVAVAVLTLFCFRLWFGLSLGLAHEDAKQVYLIGLKSYLTQTWPYFGADVAPPVQIPGALQGLVIALPLYLIPIPESPFLFLNMLSLIGLVLLAEYCVQHFPKVPPWLIRMWILTAPWTLNQSTHVYNPSYVLVGSVVFFLGAFETYPWLRLGWLRPGWANFLMGLGLGWVMQFHLSYVILLPYLATSFYSQLRERGGAAIRLTGSFVGGACVSGVFALPTMLRFGGNTGFTGQTASMIHLNPNNLPLNPLKAFDIIARFLSFASFEVPRFIGPDTATRVEFVKAHLWLAPAVMVLILVGTAQPLVMSIMGICTNKPQSPKWPNVRWLFFGTLGLLYVSFAFSRKPPHAHTFYVLFPIALLYSLYCWNEFLQETRWQICASLLLVCNLLLHLMLGVAHQAQHPWALDRQRIAQAISSGNYQALGERRGGVLY